MATPVAIPEGFELERAPGAPAIPPGFEMERAAAPSMARGSLYDPKRPMLSDDPRDWKPVTPGENRGTFVPLVEQPGQRPELGMPGLIQAPYEGAKHILERGPVHPSELTPQDIGAANAAASAAAPGMISKGAGGFSLEAYQAAHASEEAATRALGPRATPPTPVDARIAKFGAMGERPLPPEIANLSPGALDRIVRAIRDDRLTGPDAAAATAEHSALGGEGMIADLGPNVRGQVDALANMPNPGQRTVVDRLTARAKGARGRIEDASTAAFGLRQDTSAHIRQLEAQRGTAEQAVEATFGPRTNVADRMRQLEAERRTNADPLYEQYRNTEVFPTADVKSLMAPLERRGMFAAAYDLMPLEGKAVMRNFFTTGQRKSFPTAEAWTYVDQALGGRIREAIRGGNNNEARVYQQLQERLRAVLEAHPNAGDVYRRAREAYAEPSHVMDATTSGQGVWGRTVHADELRHEIASYSPQERQGFLEGARDGLQRVLDASVRGDEHAQALLMAQAAQDKLQAMGLNPARVNTVLDNMPGRVSDALQRGRELWDREVRPSDLQHELSLLSAAERAAYVEGARDNIAHRMDATGSGDTTVRKMLLSPSAREKAAILGQNADDLIRTLEVEADRKGMHNSVLANSRTQGRAAAQREFDAKQTATPNYRGVTITGMLAQSVRNAIDYVRQAAADRSMARVGSEVGDVLTRPSRDGGGQLLEALQGAAERKPTNAMGRASGAVSGALSAGAKVSESEAAGNAMTAGARRLPPLEVTINKEPREGDTATNPTTRERVIRRNGKWVPLPQ